MKEFLQQLFTSLGIFPEPLGMLLAAFFIILPFIFFGLLIELCLLRPISKWSDKRKSEQFWKQVRQGNPPEMSPWYINRGTGVPYQNMVEFLHSAKAERQMAGIRRIAERQRRQH